MGLTGNHVRLCQGICFYNIPEKQPVGRLLLSIQKQGMFLQLFRNRWERKVHAAEGLVVDCFIASMNRLFHSLERGSFCRKFLSYIPGIKKALLFLQECFGDDDYFFLEAAFLAAGFLAAAFLTVVFLTAAFSAFLAASTLIAACAAARRASGTRNGEQET